MSILNRRVQFLIDECKSEDPLYDQSVTFTMRTISNYTTLGRDCSSKVGKRINTRMSQSAYDLRLTTEFDDFHRRTINEHQYPLKDMWDWMIQNRDHLTIETVLTIFTKYPFVTVTKEEDRSLRRLRGQSLTPEERYKEVGIEIVFSESETNTDCEERLGGVGGGE